MGQCRRLNAEPSLKELLSDPIRRLVMAGDGLKAVDVWAKMPLWRNKGCMMAVRYSNGWIGTRSHGKKCAVPATPIGP